ncbi:molybdopterin-dependent oxidoreductase [bacterium]|nr:molybdopterin-dependent oxidoreductase [bacterium]
MVSQESTTPSISEPKIVRSICWSPPGCHGGCGVLLQVENGKVVKVQGDPQNSFNSGKLCVRGQAITEALYHPDRLTKPLLRAGNRGENKWSEVSFDEALDFIAERLQAIRTEYGAESVIFCKGTARDIGAYLPRLCYGFGSPNYFGFGPGSGNACYRPRVAASTAIMGGLPVPDLGEFNPSNPVTPECIVIWGANPIHSNPDGMHGGWVVDAIQRGSKLIVIDPQHTWLAAHAEYWLQLQPGSDAALALGMIHLLFKNNHLDTEFCDRWVHGVDEMRSAASSFTTEKTAELTGVPAPVIKAAAECFGKSSPAGLIWGVSVDMHPHCLSTIQSLIALFALTGNIEIPGGMVLPSDPFGMKRRGDQVRDFPEIKLKRIGAAEYPLIEYGNPYAQPDILLHQMETGKPYPIRAAWLQGTAVIPSSFADPERVVKLFGKLDFNVMVDIFMTPAAVAFADVVLPAAMYPEKDSIYLHYSQLGAINKAVDPPGECKSDAEIILETGKRLAPEYFPWKSVTEWLNHWLEPAGLTFTELSARGPRAPSIEYHKQEEGRLRADGKPGFDTPSGKIELKSSIFERCHLPELPYYTDVHEDYRKGTSDSDYPFILTTGARKPHYFCSEQRQIPSLRNKQPEPEVTMHPDAALEKGIDAGDRVRISSPHGSCEMAAVVSDAFPPMVIHCDYGWWFPEEKAAAPHLFGVMRSNVNRLLPSELQGPGGFGYPFRCYICNIERINPEMETENK